MEKVNMGVIGLGNRGSKFGKNIIMNSPNANLVAVCDTDKKRFDFFNGCDMAFYDNYDDFFNHSNLDAVMIATPDNTHLDIAKKAVKAKKHIICEKPLEINIDRLIEFREVLKGYDKVFQVGYVLRYAPLYKKVKALIESDVIGDIIIGNAIDNIGYGGYAFFHDWHRKRENIQSILIQKASHSIDILNWIINEIPTNIVAFGGLNVFGENGLGKTFNDIVTNETRCKSCKHQYTCVESLVNRKSIKKINWNDEWPDYCVYAPEIDIDDNQTVMIQYKNKSRVNYILCEFAPDYKRQYEFIGTKGKLIFDDNSNTITVTYRENNNVDKYLIDSDNAIHSGGDMGLFQDFINACSAGTIPIANFESAFISSITCLKAQESIDKKQIIDIEI